MKDIESVHANYGLGDSFTYNDEFLSFEQYPIVVEQTIKQFLFALIAVIVIVLFVTMSLRMTAVVVTVVCLVDL